MSKRTALYIGIYAVLLFISVSYEVCYHLGAEQQTTIYYGVFPYFLKLYVVTPLFYCSLASLIVELGQYVGRLHLSTESRQGCLWLTALLLAIHLVLVIVLFSANIKIPISIGTLIINYPQVFLVHGMLLSLGLHKE